MINNTLKNLKIRFSMLGSHLGSIEQLGHVFDQIVVQSQILHFLVQLPQSVLRCQKGFHSLLKSIVLHDQIPYVLLLPS